MTFKKALVGVFGLTLVFFVVLTLQKGEHGSDAVLPASSGQLAPQSQSLDSLSPKHSSGLSATAPATAISGSTKEATNGLIGLLREELGFAISDREAEIISRHYESLNADRQRLEFSLAQREVIKPGSVLITIPEYFEQGIEMYSRFGDSLIEDLGRDRGKQIGKALAKGINADNAFFGMREQQILIEHNGDTFHVVHGSGFMLKMNDQPNFAKRTSISTLLPQNLGSYEYLRPLFPVKQ